MTRIVHRQALAEPVRAGARGDAAVLRRLAAAVVLAVLVVLPAAVCYPGQPPPQRQRLNIKVDARVELLAVVQLLSGYRERYGLINDYGTPYRRDVEEYFAPHRDHAAVKLFAEMGASGFTFDAPPAAVLHLSGPPELDVVIPFTEYLERRAGGGKRLEQFVESLREFARATNFMSFFRAHAGTFLKMAAESRGNLGDIDLAGALEAYYGSAQHSYNIILAPLFRGSYGPRVKRPDGTYDIYSVSEAMGVEEGFATFGSSERLLNLVWHEFGHSFANPLGDRHAEELARYSSLFEPIAEQMRKQAYGNWQTCVNEHVVRAVHARLALRELSAEAAERLRRYDKTRGFFYVDALCERLQEYERERDKYPDLESFYPRLVDVFRELAEKGPSEELFAVPLGNINSVVTDSKSAVFVVPTSETGKPVEGRIRAHAEGIRDRFFKGRPVITDQQALERDLSSNSLIVYGTPAGNLWLARHIAELPVRIESDRIVADKTYAGRDLRFITVWPNPQNLRKGVVIYTAQRAEDVIDINSVFHGPTDYVVARGTAVLHSGSYVKDKTPWTFK